MLEQAKLRRAKALVVSFPDPTAAITTIKAARHINPDIIILARVSRRTDAEELKKLGVKLLVLPELEAGYAFVKQLLKVSGLKTDERRKVLSAVCESRKIPKH